MSELQLLVALIARSGGVPQPYSGPPRSAPLERRLGFRMPPLYRGLLDSYEWLPFEAAGLFVYGSAGLAGDRDDIATRLFLDPAFVQVLVPARLFHFAGPDTGSYDPICIDLSTPGSIDGPVIWLDHEEILCNDRIKVVRRLSQSFAHLWSNASPA